MSAFLDSIESTKPIAVTRRMEKKMDFLPHVPSDIILRINKKAAVGMAKLKSKGIAISDIDELQNLTGFEKTNM